jgi:hypothetical protein
MAENSGSVDFCDECFVVTCTFDGRVHGALRALPKVDYDQGVWRVPLHRKSVAGLMAVARSRGWSLTRRAERARGQVQEAIDLAEYFVHVVQGSSGEQVFKCRADDPDLEEALDALPGAERDDGPSTWLIPATRVAAEQLRAIVEDDGRFDIDAAAQRQLDEPEDWPEAVPAAPVEPRPEPVRLPAIPVPSRSEITVGDATTAFEREQELKAWSCAVICDAEGSALDSRLRPYQRAGVRYLRSARRAFLADDKTLGKCAQVLAAIEAEEAYPALILTAKPLELHWQHEAGSWLGDKRTWSVVEQATGSIPASDIVIADYELIYRRREELKARGFRAIVADDSTLLRNERALKTRAALEIAETVDGLRFCLSDTALVEQPLHLLPQLQFLGRIDDLHGRNAFVERYCRPTYDITGTRYGASNLDELEQRLRACCLCRRSFAQVAPQLPSLPRYRHAIATSQTASDREAELSLIAELRELSASEAEAPTTHERAKIREELHASLERLRIFAGCAKVESTSEWIDHFLSGGDLLAVIVTHAEVAALYERKYRDAVFVREDGTCVRAGQPISAFFVTEAELVFFHPGARGPAVRLAQGRYVVQAELSLGARTAELMRQLLESKTRDQPVAAWDLVSQAAADRALETLLASAEAPRPPARDDDDAEQVLQVFVAGSAAGEAELTDVADPTFRLG